MERYETIHDFCKAQGLNDPQIEEWAKTLNSLWMKDVNSEKRLSGKYDKYLEEAWRDGNLEVRGYSDWIVDLLKAGSKVRPPIADTDGTVMVLKSKEKRRLIQALEIAYGDLVITALQLSEQQGQETADGSCLYEQVAFGGTKIKLIWTLLGGSTQGHDFTEFNGHKLVKLSEHVVVEATIRDGKGDRPDRLVELNENTKVKLL